MVVLIVGRAVAGLGGGAIFSLGLSELIFLGGMGHGWRILRREGLPQEHAFPCFFCFFSAPPSWFLSFLFPFLRQLANF